MRKIAMVVALLMAWPLAAAAQTKVIPLVGNAPWSTANPAPVTCISGCSGGGGGAVTLAAGAVAAGAYVSGSILSGAYAVGALSDGANVVEGNHSHECSTLHGCTPDMRQQKRIL